MENKNVSEWLQQYIIRSKLQLKPLNNNTRHTHNNSVKKKHKNKNKNKNKNKPKNKNRKTPNTETIRVARILLSFTSK